MWRSLQHYLRERSRTASWGKQAEAAEVLAWCASYCAQYLPREVAAHVQPLFYRDQTLTVAADHPAIVQRLQQHVEPLRAWCARRAKVRRIHLVLRTQLP